MGSIIKYRLFYKGKFIEPRSRWLESVLYVDDSGCAFADEYPDHVEAYVVEVRLILGEVTFGQSADGGLLAGGDGLEGISEAYAAAQLDFDEDEGVLMAQDQVKLSVAGAVVSLDELVPPPRQVAQSELFAPRAGEPVVQPPTPA